MAPLGHVLYWLGFAVAALCFGAAAIAGWSVWIGGETSGGDEFIAVAGAMTGGGTWLAGWVCRYILSTSA